MVNPFVRRSSKVGLVLSLTLVFGLFLGVLPASASATATASVDIHNVLAGQDGKVFSITVSNAEPMALLGGRTINRILVTPPVDIMEAVTDPTAHTGPNGWTAETFGSDPTVVRFKPTGAGLAPAASATFNIATDIGNSLSADAGDTWLVRVSSDTGTSTLKATGAGNALLTQVRVLQAQNAAVVSPAGAADDRDGDGNPEVTGTQSNVCVRTRVFNASANTLNVTPAVSAPGVTFGDPRPTGGADCSGAPFTGGTSIPGGTARDFDFLAEFGNVGSKTNRNLKATASAPGACTPDTSGTCMPNTSAGDDVFVASRIVAVEPKADISYVADTLRPRVVSPGGLGKVFTLQINKGPNQSPPLGTFAGTFQTAFGNTTVASPTALPTGQALNQTVQYNAMNIANIANARYPVDVKFSYTDGNGLIQGLTTPSGPSVESIRLDSLIPKVTIDLTPPASQVQAEPPVDPAVTNGQAFNVSGTATDTDPDSGQDAPCGPAPANLRCSLTSVELIQYPLTAREGGGTPLAERINITSSCSLSALGQISCSNVTTDFADGAQATQVTATVTDEAELPGDDVDELVDVDNIDPFLQDALATRGPVAGQRRNINVPFNEAVQDTNQPVDWQCQDGSAKVIGAVTQPADKRSVNLVTGTDLHADVPGGTCTYNPSLVSSPYHDRVGQEVQDTPTVVQLRDGIAPLAPTFESVNGNVAQEDGNYYFNSSSVEITLSNGTASANDPAIANGYDVEVYKESNGQEGLQRTGDTLLCSDTSAGTSVTLTCSFGSAEGEAEVYGISIDPSGNVGDLSLATLILDMTRPIFDSATVAGTTITVTFSEALRTGDNRGQDWHFFGLRNSNGNRKEFNLSTVSGTGIARTLTIEDGEYNTTDFTPHSIRYVFKGDGARYADRAGNELLDVPEGLIG